LQQGRDFGQGNLEVMYSTTSPSARITLRADNGRKLHETTEKLTEGYSRSFSGRVRLRAPDDIDPGAHTFEVIVEPLDTPGANIVEAKLEVSGGKRPAPVYVAVRDVEVASKDQYWLWQSHSRVVSLLVVLVSGEEYVVEWRAEMKALRSHPGAERSDLCDCGGKHTSTRHHYDWCSSKKAG